ncbi:MAG: hypothetical protein Q7R79_01730 [bacterium]|nr:hypothetical protein [bacterium]
MQLDEKTVILSEHEELEMLIKEYKQTPEEHTEKSLPDIFQKIIRYALYGLVFLMPLFFLPYSFDVLELPKQTLLLGTTFIVTLLYAISAISRSTMVFRPSIMHWGIGVVLGAWVLSTVFSKYSYNSFLGVEGQQFLSLTTIASLVILSFITVNTLRQRHTIGMTYAFIGSMLLASVFALLQLRGIFILPIDLVKTTIFNTVGSYTLWGILVVLALVLSVGHVLRLSIMEIKWGKLGSVLLALCASFFLVCLLALDDDHLWIATILGLGVTLLFLYAKLPKHQKIAWLLLPTFLVVVAGTMIFFNLPKQYVVLPTDIQPSLGTSYLIAKKTISESPFFGYGPGNFQTAYTQFRPQEINAYNIQQAWMSRFNQSGSYLLTKAVSLGGVGMLAFFFLTLFFGVVIMRRLIKERLDERYILLLTIGGSLLAFAYLSFVKQGSMTIVFIAWVLLACALLLISRKITVIEGEHSNKFFILTSLALFTLIACGGIGLYFQSQRYMADISYRGAQELDQRLAAQSRNGQPLSPVDIDTLVDTLSAAVRRDSQNHEYLRALSQALLLKASGLMQDREKLVSNAAALQTITGSAIDMAKRAYDLNSADVRNTNNLATLYQEISPITDGASQLAIEYFKKSQELDPKNPLVLVDFAKFYLSSAALAEQISSSAQNEEEKKKAGDIMNTALLEAEKLLNEAIVLKTDFATAYVLLATIKNKQSNSQEAIAQLDKALSANIFLVQVANVGDPDLFYAIGSQYKLLGQKEKAQRAFALAATVNQNHLPALWEFALLQVEMGKKEDAVKILERILQIDPTNTTVEAKLKELQAPPAAVITPPPVVTPPEKK